MKPALRLACLAAIVLSIAACGETEKKAPQKGTAEGEILPGSASDAMLPYDTVQSQPPLAPLPVATGKAGAKGAGKDDAASTASTASNAAADAGPGEAPVEEAPAAPAAPPKPAAAQ